MTPPNLAEWDASRQSEKPKREDRKATKRKASRTGFYGPEWAKAKQDALKRDDYRCRVCRSREGVEVHHATHIGFKGRDDAKHALTNLLSLCWKHHAQAEDGTLSRATVVELIARANGKERPTG